MDDDYTYGSGPVLPFDRNSHDFAMGVEVGRLWEQLKDPAGFDQTIHPENIEMVMRMQEAAGREMHVEDSPDGGWVFLIVDPQLCRFA